MILLQKVLALILSLAISVSAQALQVSVQKDGQYDVTVEGRVWLQSGPLFVNKDAQTWYAGNSTSDLNLIRIRNVSYPDLVDPSQETQLTYSFGNSSDQLVLGIRVYTKLYKERVVFKQTYVSGASNTSIGGEASFNKTISGFPCFLVQNGDEDLGFLSYGGYMFGNTEQTTGRFTNLTDNINDGIIGGPLALFNIKGQTLVISPLDNFMAASQWHDGKPGGHIGWGIMGGVNNIPANFTHRTVVVYDRGVNSAFSKWGSTVWDREGVFDNLNRIFERSKNQTNDISLNYLGYWTDNGAYYYYQPETNRTLEQTLIDVKRYADNASIPYRYMQLDSWWYPKDTQYRAVLTWTPMDTVFPHGLVNLSEAIGLPFVAHNRYWSKDTPYAKQNNGSYDWIIGKVGSLPNDLEFWRHIMQEGQKWGLVVYEQDWLNVQTQYLDNLQTSLTLGRDWLMQMGQAAAENNITIQYCMALPRHALQSTEIPVVTQTRVSDDFLYLRPDQWKIGVTSIFADVMHLRPYKDTFWTSSVQPGNPYNKTSLYPELESAVSSLSKGPVGPGDMISGTNMSLLMRCCSKDGRLLKPSHPARAIDLQIIQDAFATDGSRIGEIWMTQAFVSTNHQDKEYGLLFAADIHQPINITIKDLKFNVLQEGVYYPYNDVTQWKLFDANTTISLSGCSKASMCLYYFSPYISKNPVIAVLGEVSKWIPMSPDRFLGITSMGATTSVLLQGADQEGVAISYIHGNQLRQVTCSIQGNTPPCVLKGPEGTSTVKPSSSWPVTTSGSPLSTSGMPTKSSPSPAPQTTTHNNSGSRFPSIISGIQVVVFVLLWTLMK